MEPAAKRARVDVLYKAGRARLVRCGPFHTQVGGSGEVDLEPLVEKAPTLRRLVWALVDLPEGSATSFLDDSAFMAARVGPRRLILLHKSADKAPRLPEGAQAYKLREGKRDPLPLAKALLAAAETVEGNMALEGDAESAPPLEARDVAAMYLHLKAAEYHAHVIDLKEKIQRYDGAKKGEGAPPEPTAEERFLVAHARDMEQLRRDLVEEQQAKLLFQDAREEPLVYPKDFDFSGLRAWRVNVLTGERVQEPVVKAIWAAIADRKAVVFYGLAGCGKTPMARALAAFLARAKKSNSFVVTQTVDSLR
jgi:hypothetical protein